MAGPDIVIEAPATQPRQGGLSDAATYRPNDRLGVAAGVVYQSNGCTFPDTEELRCYAETPPADKTFDGITTLDGIGAPFVIYGSVECAIGPDDDFTTRATRIHNEGRDRVLEDQLETWAAGGTALAAGGSPVGALAKVEQALDDQYLRRGTILISRETAVILDAAGAIRNVGGKLFTVNDTPVVASGKVSGGVVYGLGAIVVEHSAVVVNQVENLENNHRYALAEAVYAIAVDCAFRVKSTTTT